MFSELGGDDILITGGTFNSARRDFHVHHTYTSSANQDRAIKLLCKNIAPDAFHNSAERFDAPKCHPQTRKVILQEIMDWIEDLDKSESFLWLYGPAGAGKSAILQSIAELCYKVRVVASFFFSRSAPGRNDARLLIPTLAYQFTISVPEMRRHIVNALDRDPVIFSRSLQAQMEALIFEPLTKVAVLQGVANGPNSRLQPISIIIDGLDECNESKTQRYLLHVISSTIQRSGLPIFFLVASRPEQDIREAFNGDPLGSMTRRIVLDDNYEPDADIRVFLTSKFDEIKQHHPLKHHLPASWPSDLDIDCLVQKASGQFIYASTVMKFVESRRHRPTERLKVIFGLEPPGKNMPFVELDALYTLIFLSVDDIEAVTDVLVYLLFFDSRVTLADSKQLRRPHVIEDFLSRRDGELQIILTDLHSIIYVPAPSDLNGDVRLFHASLGDFLMDKARSGSFFIDTQHAHTRLARCCIKTVAFSLSTNSTSRISTHISYTSLMEQCVMAYPSEGLVQDLWNFHFSGFLNFGIQPGFSPPLHISSELPRFFDWIKEKNYLNHENDLHTCYIHHFDTFLITQLSHYPQEPVLYHLLTAVTLLPTGSSTFAAITNSMDLSKVEETDDATLQFRQLGTYMSLDPNSRGYHLMLIAFLSDDTRSGIYHVTGSRYISLALKCSENLVNPSSFDVRRSILDLLCRSLLRAPSDHQLGIYLRDNINQITPDCDIYSRTEESCLLIVSYIQKCNLNNPEVVVQPTPIFLGLGSQVHTPMPIALGLGSWVRKWFKEIVLQE